MAKVIARNAYDQEVWLITYTDGGKRHTDLATDGRVLLTPLTALKIAKALTAWAAKTKAKQAEVDGKSE